MAELANNVLSPNGPYPTIELDFWVKADAGGVFALSQDGMKIDYLGSAEKNIRSAIKGAAAKENNPKFFLFSYTISQSRMLYVSCNWFHILGTSEKIEHPVLSSTVFHGNCPVAGCKLNTRDL